jgi:hypothetical protein
VNSTFPARFDAVDGARRLAYQLLVLGRLANFLFDLFSVYDPPKLTLPQEDSQNRQRSLVSGALRACIGCARRALMFAKRVQTNSHNLNQKYGVHNG